MTEILNQYWPLILIGLLVLVAPVWLATRRRQRVSIGDVDPVIAATLARSRAPEPLSTTSTAISLDATSPQDIADDLRRIKGLGPKVAARLAELGVTRIDQLASLDADQRLTIDAQLGPFAGRMARDRWVEQAGLLVGGDTAAFEAQFGKLG